MRAVCRVTDAWKSGHAPRAQAALFLVVLSGVRQASLGAGCGSTARGAGQLLFQNPSSAVVRGTAGGRQVVSATGRCKVTAAPVAPWRTSARALLRARFALRAEPVARSDADAAGDDLGALLRTWGAEDAREALEANGFTSAQRIRDLLEVDDLPELGLPLATRKILARLIKHLADEKKRGQAAAVKERVASLLDDRGSFADDAQGLVLREAAAQKRKADNDLYNKDATVTLRKWENFHRVISQEISDGAGQLELRAIEEIELDAPVNEDALNTWQVPPREEGDDLPHTVPLSGGRGGRHEAARRRVLAPPTPVEQGQKQKRHFRYRTRDGDFFVKVVLTGEPVDIRSDDEKQDDAGDVMDMFLSGNFEDGNPDLRALFMGQGVHVADTDLNGGGGLALGGDGAGCNLILDIPEDLQTQLLGAKEPDQALKYPHTFYRGEQVSLATIRSTAQMLVPAPIVAGDLLDPEYVANHMDARRPASDLVSGGYGVLEWVELQRNLNPTVVSDVAEQLARMHLASAGMSRDYGFSVNTFLGEREQDNTMQEGVDVLDFFTSRRLEPELDAACRSSTKRAGTIPPKLLDEIGVKGFKIMERLQESDVWRDLIFSPVREQGPRLLHGDLWLGNMAIDTQSRPYVVGPASWYGPADFDLAIGCTFGMPERFLQAYRHYCPEVEASKERAMLYRLYVLLNHLNQPASYKFSSNIDREPLFRYDPTDNFLGAKTFSSFATTTVLNPGKHSYRSEMEMITRGGWFELVKHAKQVNTLMDDILAMSPPKSGSSGQIFKFWGKSAPDTRAKRIHPPAGMKIIPFGQTLKRKR